MEEGHLTDARGRKVDFRNAIIVMTSNVGADTIKRKGESVSTSRPTKISKSRSPTKTCARNSQTALKRVFRPEFINRVDSVIIFRSLKKDELRSIVNLEIEKVAERLKEHNLTIQPTDAALNLLSELGYEREYGARPLKRVIQNKIEVRSQMPCSTAPSWTATRSPSTSKSAKNSPRSCSKRASLPGRKKKTAPPAPPAAEVAAT